MRYALSTLLLSVLSTAVPGALGAQEWQPPARPIPYPVDVTRAFQGAIDAGTRSTTGAPGPNYWQQWTDYTIHARLDAEEKTITGTVRMVYRHNGPQRLPVLSLQLLQNLHAEGAMRNEQAEVTGGMEITRLTVQGETLREVTMREARSGQRGFIVYGTAAQLRLPRPLSAGESAALEIDFSFDIPQAGAGSRMGWSRDNLFYLAYWYPQMAVFDDIEGWQTDAFLGNAEFYMGYGNYDVTLEVPAGWVTMGTGTLMNPNETLAPEIAARLERAASSDDVVHVVTEADFGAGKSTRASDSGYLTWRFVADSVRDVAYSITRESMWDAARSPVGDRDGDGQTDYIRVDAIYRATAPRWAHAWRYAQHSIDFLSRWTGYSYPWPHMTAVEGDDIMGGGMEYPMMTLISGYTNGSDTALYSVTAHELAHMWVPMIVGNDERRMAWMDEGTTSFNGSAAEMEFYPGLRADVNDMNSYVNITRTDAEGPIMTWSDYHTNGYAYGTASYGKPASVLWALRGLLGEETFTRAFQTYIRRWAFKHPKPWDMFNTFSDVSGQNLDWFWRTWYYETWALDQAVGSVTAVDGGTRIVVQDRGRAPMPARLTITTEGGETLEAEIPVERWLEGATSAEVTVRTATPVVKVEIDAKQHFPDTDRRNNTWERRT